MAFVVAPECLALGLRAGAVVFRGVRVGPAPDELRAEIIREAERVRAEFTSPDQIRALPEVVAFETVLRRVGVNPRRLQPSVARLLTFALKRGDLPAINSLVDAYNLASVRSRCSLGAHDLGLVTPPISLRLFRGDESFTPLGANDPEPVAAGEFGYVDAAGRVLCRLDVLQADFSKVTAQTRDALLIVEGTAEHAPEQLRRATGDAVELITRYCGGTADVVAWPGTAPT
jgi:DNA/RNA-binding domain of Phe-tRNA-synthetase-like protein